MTVTEPLPSGLIYGAANWVNYSNYWREEDAEWMQKRIILRFATAGDRASGVTSPEFGQVTYNDAIDRLETYSRVAAAWSTIQQFVNLTSTQDTAAGVSVSHKNAGGKGVVFEPNRFTVTNPLYVTGGALQADTSGVTVGSQGGKYAKLTTDATNLVSDSPVSAPGFVTGGTLTAVTLNVSGTLTAQNISVSGTLQGGVVNGTSGAIGGIALGTAVVGGSGIVNASAGLQSQAGMFYGDGTSAFMRQRVLNSGAQGAAFIQVQANDSYLGGTNVWINAATYLRIQGGRGIPWHNAAGTHQAWISPVIVSATDPGAANFPDGSLWVVP